MNTELLTRIAEWLEAGAPPMPDRQVAGFDQTAWIEPANGGIDIECGTVCCVAGIAMILRYGSANAAMAVRAASGWSYSDIANNALGLSDVQAIQLFYGGMDAKPVRAARTIRRLIATGRVDWEGHAR